MVNALEKAAIWMMAVAIATMVLTALLLTVLMDGVFGFAMGLMNV